MSSVNIQASIKNNTEDLISFVADLKNWEKEIKAEDAKLREKNLRNEDKSLKFDKNLKVEDQTKTMNNQQRAEKLKEEGNKFYSEGKLHKAVDKYEEGISLDPTNALLFANRAMAYIKLEKYNEAVSDCGKSLELDRNYIKAYLRRATALTNLSKFSAAIADYNEVLKIEPWNKDAKRELEKLKNKEKKTLSIKDKSEVKSTIDNVSLISERNKVDITDDFHTDNSNKRSNKDLQSSNIVELKFPSKREVTSSARTSRVKPAPLKDVSPIRIMKHSRIQDPPPPPRTSHQFYLDWKKVSNYDSLAEAYLLSIPGSFFHGVEVDVDQLVEVVHHLNGDSIEPHVVVELLQSLMKSTGFYLNLAFLEPEQKREFENVIKKIEDHGLINEDIRKIKKSLLL